MTTTLKEQIENLNSQLKQYHDSKQSLNVFKDKGVQVTQILKKDQARFYKKMAKICRLFPEIVNLNESIETLVEEFKSVK